MAFHVDIEWWDPFRVDYNDASLFQDQHLSDPDTILTADRICGYISFDYSSKCFQVSVLCR